METPAKVEEMNPSNSTGRETEGTEEDRCARATCKLLVWTALFNFGFVKNTVHGAQNPGQGSQETCHCATKWENDKNASFYYVKSRPQYILFSKAPLNTNERLFSLLPLAQSLHFWETDARTDYTHPEIPGTTPSPNLSVVLPFPVRHTQDSPLLTPRRSAFQMLLQCMRGKKRFLEENDLFS